MIQESKLLIARSLINYSKLPTTKSSVFDDAGEFMFKRVRRAGCPLSEKELKRQMIDCTSSILKDIGLEQAKRFSLIAGLERSNPENIGENAASNFSSEIKFWGVDLSIPLSNYLLKEVNMVKHTSRDTYEKMVITGGTVIISDPCYDRSTWCMGKADNVLPGSWHVRALNYADEHTRDAKTFPKVDMSEESLKAYKETGKFLKIEPVKYQQTVRHNRISALLIHNEAYSLDELKEAELSVVDGCFGVDSGQLGFFDDAFFPQEGRLSDEQYNAICRLTVGEDTDNYNDHTIKHELIETFCDFGVYNNACAVSASGYGDGSYPVVAFELDDKIVGLMAVYVFHDLTSDIVEDENDDDDEEQDRYSLHVAQKMIELFDKSAQLRVREQPAVEENHISDDDLDELIAIEEE